MTSLSLSPFQLITAFYNSSETVGETLRQTRVSEIAQSVCPICRSSEVTSNGVIVCRSCGSELGSEIQNGFETQYGCTNDESRCNNVHNPLLDETNYNTGIAGENNHLKRLNKWAYVPYLEKMLSHEFRRIEEICRASGLNSNINSTTQLLYKEAVTRQKASLNDKKRKVGLLEACLYYACAQHHAIYTHRDIAQFCGSSETRVTRGCKSYFQLMAGDQKICGEDSLEIYIERFSDSLGLNSVQKRYVKELSDRVHTLDIFNEAPPSIAGACLYLASVIYNFRLNKSIIALQSGVSEVTLAKIYKKMLKSLDLLLV